MLKSASVAARVCAAGAAEPPAEEPPAALPEASVAVDVAAPAEVLLPPLPPLLLVPLLVPLLELPPPQAVRTTAAAARTRAAAPRAGRRRAGGVLVRWDTRAPTRPTVDRPGRADEREVRCCNFVLLARKSLRCGGQPRASPARSGTRRHHCTTAAGTSWFTGAPTSLRGKGSLPRPGRTVAEGGVWLREDCGRRRSSSTTWPRFSRRAPATGPRAPAD